MNANAFNALLDTLRKLNIEHTVVGSVASSAHGIERSTVDTDLLARIKVFHANRLSADLGNDWYADPDQMRAAIESQRSFNLIHIPSGEKFDIFPAFEEFHASELSRAIEYVLPLADGPVRARVSSAEDVLLAKLRWYQAGGEVSDRQWNDITGILCINTGLDMEYVNGWAGRLGVSHLLAKAIADSQT
jgi:hypothetical protein